MVIGYLTSLYARAADTFIRHEVRELRRRGHVVHTFSIRGPAREEAVDGEILREQQSTEYILAAHPARLLASCCAALARHPARLLAALRIAWRTCAPGIRALVWQTAYLVEALYLADRLRAKGVEHLHDHIGTNSATVAMLAARLAGIPWSMTVHGPVEFDAPERWALAEKIRSAAFTVCVSSFGRSQCARWVPFEAWPRIEVVRCGLDAEFLEAASEPAPAEPRLVSVGRLSEQKGQLILLEAAARLVESGVRCELRLVGDGPLRGLLERRIRSLGLDDCVHLLGWTDGAGVRSEILRSRALVLPSLAEGLPVSIMEALALRRPVISTWVAGIPELVEDGRNGWLVPPGSVDELARSMRAALAASPSDLDRMGREGAARVKQLHDLRAQGERLERLIRAAIGRS